ncbi:MAG TPA: LUD domain-containing protein [Bryobacteraceae bacterium]|nr:LUD domain-containing protein [Bryobacteraceae bacterium]
MSTAREEILRRINSVKHSVTDEPVPRNYNRTGVLDAAERIELFCDRLHDYGSTVHHAGPSRIPAVIGEILSERGKRGLLVSPGLPEAWLPDGFAFARDHSLSYPEIDSSEGVLTGCAVAIALTGTIVLRHSEQEGRRALTLIPDYHLCVVFEDQVVETVSEGINAMGSFASSPITTISGPSATSDIEMTRIKGVHGPRTLEVILVSAADEEVRR